MNQHMEDTIIILNEGNGPHPRYEQCDMFLPQETLTTGHIGTKMSRMGAEQKCHLIDANYSNVYHVATGTELRARYQIL